MSRKRTPPGPFVQPTQEKKGPAPAPSRDEPLVSLPRPAEPEPLAIPRGFDPSTGLPAPREAQPTITNEVELEAARLRSVQRSSSPPDHASRTDLPPILSLANAIAPSVPPASHDDASVPDELPTAPPPPDALQVISRERGPDPRVEMRDRYNLGDYTGALQVAEQILQEHPGNVEAVNCAERCRQVLTKMYAARLGPLERVPVVIVASNQLRWLSLDHRAGFVLSHIDGVSNLEMILDVSGMPTLDCMRILYELVQQRIVGFR